MRGKNGCKDSRTYIVWQQNKTKKEVSEGLNNPYVAGLVGDVCR
jgi:hypothetical protein